MLTRKHLLGAVIVLLAVTVSGRSQSASSAGSTHELRGGMNEFGIWGGGAFTATAVFGGLHPDETAGRKYLTMGLRYGRVLAAKKRVALEYTLDVIPVAIAFHTIVGNTTPPPASIRENAYGWGFEPLGLRAIFSSRRVKPFAGLSGGELTFSKPVPRPEAGKFAYTLTADGGVDVFTKPRHAVRLAIKFHHISNGNRSGANRGLNQFIVYAGYSVFK